MPKAVRIHQTGGPEKLVWEEVEVGLPGPGQVRLRHTAVGLNYVDTYFRSGLYPLKNGLKGTPVKVKTERDIFDHLRVKYLTPKEREM